MKKSELSEDDFEDADTFEDYFNTDFDGDFADAEDLPCLRIGQKFQ